MEPFSALVFSWVATALLTGRGAADTAWSQARAEARIAAEAIRKDLKARREQRAKDLVAKLEGGREGGPSRAAWWGWAGLRAAQAVRRAARREPRAEEDIKAVKGVAGPWRRIWDAGVRGGRYAYGQRYAPGRPARLGVCDRCGIVVARTSLRLDEDAQELVCARCATRRTTPAAATVEDARRPEAPEPPQLGPPPPPPPPAPAPGLGPAPEPNGDGPAPLPPAQGDTMSARNPGQVVLRRHAPLNASSHRARASGEALTHGQFQHAVARIEAHLEELPAALEAMLQKLTSADAGRSQVQDVLRLHRDTTGWMVQVRDMLEEVDRREQPMLNAVAAAGGPDEIAGLDYYRDV